MSIPLDEALGGFDNDEGDEDEVHRNIEELPPLPQILTANYDEPLTPLPKLGDQRYSRQAAPEQLAEWAKIFKQFDRDGGGDVDLRELGLMMRNLGQQPSEAQMKLLIEEVDIDQSGTIDFEEFCLLMMRQARTAECPEWLYHMLHPPLFGEPLPDGVNALPTVATLNDGRYDAAQRIRRHVGLGSGEAVRASQATEQGTTSTRPKELDAARFSRELLLTVCDLLPSAEHITVGQMCGHGTAFGPLVAQELLWRLATSRASRAWST